MELLKLNVKEIRILKIINKKACKGITFNELLNKSKFNEIELENILKKLENIHFIEYRKFSDGINDYDIEREGQIFLEKMQEKKL